MKLIILDSGSKANGYVLTNGAESLIIEAGVNPKEMMKAVDFNMSSVVGCVVSHAHGDHSKFIEKYSELGIEIYMSKGASSELKGVKKTPTFIKEGQKLTIGNFEIYPFNVYHDCAEPLGFVIDHPEIGRLLFATDTSHLTQQFAGLTNVMLEANYSPKTIKKLVGDGLLDRTRYDRVINNHMSIDTTIKLLNKWDLSKVRNIVLLHLSDTNSTEPEMIKQTIEATGINTIAAKKGIEIELNLF